MNANAQRYRPTGLNETITDQYGIEVYYSIDKLQAIFYAGRSTKKWWWYNFTSIDRMITRIYESIDRHIQRENEKKEKKEIEKKAFENFKASDYYAIGDIVVNTWGYEQTNVEFYQVIEVLNKKIRVREICQNTVKCVGAMSSEVMPDRDNFYNDKILLLSLRVEFYNDKMNCRICNPESFYYFRKWEGTSEYCSWYA